MKKVSVLFVALVLVATAGVNAQSYKTGIGAKFYSGSWYGSVGGINIKHSTSSNTALEDSLLFFSGGVGVEGLYEYQGPINNAPGLMYFVGGGGLLGFGNGRRDKHDDTNFALRLTGGLDYKFADAPIAVSLGLDPFFNLTPSTGSHLALGIGIRYVLK